jgi:hypothetical protein
MGQLIEFCTLTKITERDRCDADSLSQVPANRLAYLCVCVHVCAVPGLTLQQLAIHKLMNLLSAAILFIRKTFGYNKWEAVNPPNVQGVKHPLADLFTTAS